VSWTLTLSVIKTVKYFFLSPITIQLLTRYGNSTFIASSIGIGAIFSPPAVITISFILPVIYKNPSPSIFAKSINYTLNIF
jgi:hypothetical protein